MSDFLPESLLEYFTQDDEFSSYSVKEDFVVQYEESEGPETIISVDCGEDTLTISTQCGIEHVNEYKIDSRATLDQFKVYKRIL